jgi:hypothetical protein
MQMNDKLALDISDDTEMKDYLARKSAGDECSFTVTASLDESTGEQAVFSVKHITINSYDEDEGEGEGEESEEIGKGAPAVMMIMAGKKRGSDKASGSY